ncbi:MAG: hypothetical protein Kow0069_36720 [Promethearchaeota archaeon]
MKTRQVLNRLFWDPHWRKFKRDVELVYIHRGNPGDVKVVAFEQIIKVLPSFFVHVDEVSGQEVQIPYHRILTIRNRATGAEYYRKSDVA